MHPSKSHCLDHLSEFHLCLARCWLFYPFQKWRTSLLPCFWLDALLISVQLTPSHSNNVSWSYHQFRRFSIRVISFKSISYLCALEIPIDQRQLLSALQPLLQQYNTYADQGNLPQALATFEQIYYYLQMMPQYITDPQSRQFFIDNYLTKSQQILINLRNGRGLSEGKGLLTPLLGFVGNFLNGAVGAVSADLNGLFKGLSTAVGLLAKGDIIGAATHGIGDVLTGKVNAIKSILGIFGWIDLVNYSVPIDCICYSQIKCKRNVK